MFVTHALSSGESTPPLFLSWEPTAQSISLALVKVDRRGAFVQKCFILPKSGDKDQEFCTQYHIIYCRVSLISFVSTPPMAPLVSSLINKPSRPGNEDDVGWRCYLSSILARGYLLCISLATAVFPSWHDLYVSHVGPS